MQKDTEIKLDFYGLKFIPEAKFLEHVQWYLIATNFI